MDRTAVDVRVVTPDGVQACDPADLPALLRGPDLVWVDVPLWDEAAAAALVEPLGLHAGAVRECAERNPLPKVHLYPDHTFVVLHAPEAGHHGHVHYIELDQFIGPNWLVTVHGPLGKGVDPAAAQTETRAVLRRLEAGRLRADSAAALSYALVDRADRTAAGLPVPRSPRRCGGWSRRSWPGTSATRRTSWRSCSAPGTGCWPPVRCRRWPARCTGG